MKWLEDAVMKWKNAFLAVAAVVLVIGTVGCHWLFAWAAAPRHPMQTFKAEYDLKADRLVIVIYAGTDLLFEHPAAPLEISSVIAYQLTSNLGHQVKQIVDPAQVIRWQESKLDWSGMPLVDIAKAFQADTLLYVEMERYSTVEERSANLYRGRVRARVQVVKTEASRNPVYETTVETTFPEDRPIGVLDASERQIRGGTNAWFARDVVRKFHEYKVEIKGGGIPE